MDRADAPFVDSAGSGGVTPSIVFRLRLLDPFELAVLALLLADMATRQMCGCSSDSSPSHSRSVPSYEPNHTVSYQALLLNGSPHPTDEPR